MGLNDAGYALANDLADHCAEFGVERVDADRVRLLDCGVRAVGSVDAGLGMARIAMGGAGEVSVLPAGDARREDTAWAGCPWQTVVVSSERPVAACLAAQYAGHKVATSHYFAMASGPVRAAIGREAIFDAIGMREQPKAAVGLLESSRLPPGEVCVALAEAARVTPDRLTLLVARTASAAGTLQVVARSLETALHKLHDLGFDLTRIRRGSGKAPLPPVPNDDLVAIGLTNDAILYGGSVTLEVTGDDASLAAIGPRAVSRGSPSFGEPFLSLFEAAGRDFYAMDPALFAPARLALVNVDTGERHSFGDVEPNIVASSFMASEKPSMAGR